MNALFILLGIIILIPIAKRATRNLRDALKQEKEIYCKSIKNKFYGNHK